MIPLYFVFQVGGILHSNQHSAAAINRYQLRVMCGERWKAILCLLLTFKKKLGPGVKLLGLIPQLYHLQTL